MRGCEAFSPTAAPSGLSGFLLADEIEERDRQRAISGRRWGALVVLFSSAAFWLGAWQVARLVI
jgi:hypothetical protein